MIEEQTDKNKLWYGKCGQKLLQRVFWNGNKRHFGLTDPDPKLLFIYKSGSPKEISVNLSFTAIEIGVGCLINSVQLGTYRNVPRKRRIQESCDTSSTYQLRVVLTSVSDPDL